MCVRKTSDTGGTPTMQGSSLNSGSTGSTAKPSRRHKPLKAIRSRGGGTTAGGAKQPEQVAEKRPLAPTGTAVEVDCSMKVRDDPDGHLIYHKGDLVDLRCKFGQGFSE